MENQVSSGELPRNVFSPPLTGLSLRESPKVEFTFNSIPGRAYKIEASTSLPEEGQPGGWVELDDGFEAEGNESSYVDFLSVVTEPHVFYRVQLMPR